LDIKALSVIKYGSTDLFSIPGVLEKPGVCFELQIRDDMCATSINDKDEDEDNTRQDKTRPGKTRRDKKKHTSTKTRQGRPTAPSLFATSLEPVGLFLVVVFRARAKN
jgi:hypothetical protein